MRVKYLHMKSICVIMEKPQNFASVTEAPTDLPSRKRETTYEASISVRKMGRGWFITLECNQMSLGRRKKGLYASRSLRRFLFLDFLQLLRLLCRPLCNALCSQHLDHAKTWKYLEGIVFQEQESTSYDGDAGEG